MSFYTFVCGLLRGLTKILYRVEVIGAENIPDEGNLIIISNHKSFLDPVFLVISVKNRRIVPIAKQELFKIPVVSWVIKKIDTIPVNRDNPSLSTFREVLNQINKGNVLGIFPEGTRCFGNEFLPAKPGVAMFAMKAKANVVPMSIISTFRLFSKVKIVIDKPIDLSEYHNRKVKKDEYPDIAQKCFDVVVENYRNNMEGIIKK